MRLFCDAKKKEKRHHRSLRQQLRRALEGFYHQSFYWMIHLSEDLERRLREEVRAIKSAKFPEMTKYVTSWERFAMEEGEAEGEAEGKAEGKAEGEAKGKLEMVIRLLEKRCGDVPKSFRKRVSALPCDQLEELFDEALAFSSADDLSKWFES